MSVVYVRFVPNRIIACGRPRCGARLGNWQWGVDGATLPRYFVGEEHGDPRLDDAFVLNPRKVLFELRPRAARRFRHSQWLTGQGRPPANRHPNAAPYWGLSRRAKVVRERAPHGGLRTSGQRVAHRVVRPKLNPGDRILCPKCGFVNVVGDLVPDSGHYYIRD